MKVRILMLMLLPACFTAVIRESDGQSGPLRITYRQVVNGSERVEAGHTQVLAGPSFSVSRVVRDEAGFLPQTPRETEYVDYERRTAWQAAVLADSSRIHQRHGFAGLPALTVTEDRDTLLGFPCVKATATLRSNSLEIWYTGAAGCRGTPAMAYGIPDGLVLKIVRNNNFALEAVSVGAAAGGEIPRLPETLGDSVGQAYYRHRITRSFVTSLEVFSDEQICWNPSGDATAEAPEDSVVRYAGGTVILRKVRLPEVTGDYQIFAELTQYSNGDAYDRTGTVFLVAEGREKSFLNALREGIGTVPHFTARNGKSYQGMTATPGFLPAVEIMRFFTPFGIRHYNEQVQVYGQQWEEEARYKQEVTDLAPLLRGEVWIGVYIGNYDRGGHKVSLRLDYHPGSPRVGGEPAPGKWLLPAFNTLNIMEMAGQNYGTLFDTDSLVVEFDLPEGVRNPVLRYISTGHGGWGGGDEFNPRENRILIDGVPAASHTPWRTDCATFRRYNPSSGNSWNGLTSSDYSRSGWCPGSVTVPVYLPLTGLKPGRHLLKIAIPQGAPEGNSFSAWSVSGLLMGDR